MFVASTYLYADFPLLVENADTHQRTTVQIKRFKGYREVTYLVQSLPPGHYYIDSLVSYAGGSTSLRTPNGYFEVQAGCFNYAGSIDLYSLENEQPDLDSEEVAQAFKDMPESIRSLVQKSDVCISALGHASVRISYAQARDLFDL